mgnify:FL=1
MSITKQLTSKFFGRDRLFARRTSGGIRLQQFKEHSMRSRIMSTPIPQQLTIPVGAEDSGEFTLLVSSGDHVRKFQRLAIFNMSAEAFSSVPVHAPTSGIITSIENSSVADHAGPVSYTHLRAHET